MKKEGDGFLDLTPYRNCRLCPRQCGVDRIAGETGVCGETASCRIAAAEPHFGEEPSFSGRRGSGAVFFSGCSCRCFFCQNYQISLEGMGTSISFDKLAETARRLVDRGVHNLNFVTPDHFWPHIEALALHLRNEKCRVPLLYNGSGYHSIDPLSRAVRYMDLFLPDFKIANPGLARSVMGDSRYPDLALAALDLMIDARGFLEPWDPTGALPARHGVLVRHLVLPGHIDNSLAVLDLLRRRYGRYLPLSVMRQFQPTSNGAENGRFRRTVSENEYARVCSRVVELGFEHVYLQDAPDAHAPFFPDFRRVAPFEGNREQFS